MTTQEQDKIWNDLSEESKDRVISLYNGDTSGVGSQFAERKKCYERIFGSHNLKSQMQVTYDTILSDLKEVGKYRVISANLVYTSRKQFEKVEAHIKLLNVAAWLNGDWKPDWSDGEQDKYFIGIDNSDNKELIIKRCWFGQYDMVYFRTEELAEQAIQILGKETIRLTLTTDY